MSKTKKKNSQQHSEGFCFWCFLCLLPTSHVKQMSMSLFTDQVCVCLCVWEKAHVTLGVSCLPRLSSNSPENQTYFIPPRNDPVQIKVKTKSFSFKNTTKPGILIFLSHDWMLQNVPLTFFLRALTSSPWESLVCSWVLIGGSSGGGQIRTV